MVGVSDMVNRMQGNFGADRDSYMTSLTRPELLILDEPLHGLDMYNRRLVKDVIEAFCQRKDKTLIMVTHYKEELPACIDHSLYLVRNR